MTLRRLCTALLLITVAAFCAFGQSEPKAQVDETNLDTQLYLIIGTNQATDSNAPIPASLASVVKQLRATLPFKNYGLAATLINRVKNEGRLSLRWIGGPLAPGAGSPSTPTFSEFKVTSVKLVADGSGPLMIRMENFSFGARIPIFTNPLASTASAPPVFNYEATGVTTDISMREGEPVIVGTLNIGPSGDAIILVVSAKRTAQ